MKELDDALAALRTAQTLYAGAKEAREVASREETSALNKLNEAQKQFDAAVATVREAPEWGTEWHRQKHPGCPA